VVDECALAVDLDHRQPLAVLRLELGIVADVHFLERDAGLRQDRARTLTEVAVARVVEDDSTDRSRGWSLLRRRVAPRGRRRRGASTWRGCPSSPTSR